MATLVVDSTAKPIGLTPEADAVSRLAQAMIEGAGKIQAMVSDESRRYRSQFLDIPAPVIVMAQTYVEIPEVELHQVNRKIVFARDKYQCQYCGMIGDSGKTRRQLTMDHVKPARLFETKAKATTWDNVTTACMFCNQKKGDKLPYECGMMPKTTPKVPHYAQLRFAGRLNPAQRDYVADYFGWDPNDLGIFASNSQFNLR